MFIVSFSYNRKIVLFPGFVIFSVFSESLILGINFPVCLSLIAANLYTPPKAGQSLEVIKFVPTPQEVNSLLIFDPIETWKKTLLKPNTYTIRELMIPIFMPKAGQSLEVIKFVPTPQEVIADPCVFKLSIRYSSKSLEAEITASENPASSNIFLASFDK